MKVCEVCEIYVKSQQCAIDEADRQMVIQCGVIIKYKIV